MRRQNDLFNNPLRHESVRAQLKVLPSMWLHDGQTMQARIREELVTEILARTGAKSIDELIRKMEMERKKAITQRRQQEARIVETPARLREIERQQQQRDDRLEQLPVSVQNAIRYLYKTIARIQTSPVPAALQAELRIRERQIEQLDKSVETLKSVCTQLKVNMNTTTIREALDRANRERFKLLDRILTIKQHIEQIERETQR